MKAVALSAKKRSLSDFQAAVKTYKVQLEDDLIVSKHLDSLYNSMLEQNLCRYINISLLTKHWCFCPNNKWYLIQYSNISKKFKIVKYFISGSLSPTVRCRLTMLLTRLDCLNQRWRRSCRRWSWTRSSWESWIKKLVSSSSSPRNQGNLRFDIK